MPTRCVVSVSSINRALQEGMWGCLFASCQDTRLCTRGLLLLLHGSCYANPLHGRNGDDIILSHGRLSCIC